MDWQGWDVVYTPFYDTSVGKLGQTFTAHFLCFRSYARQSVGASTVHLLAKIATFITCYLYGTDHAPIDMCRLFVWLNRAGTYHCPPLPR